MALELQQIALLGFSQEGRFQLGQARRNGTFMRQSGMGFLPGSGKTLAAVDGVIQQAGFSSLRLAMPGTPPCCLSHLNTRPAI